MAATLALLVAANVAAACALEVADARDGTRLVRVPLPADGSFALRYTHSVTLRPVESRYVVRDSRIVLTAEVFDAHGPGMASEAQPGERWETRHTADGPRFVLHTERPVPRLVVRLHPLPAFKLGVGTRTIDLSSWGTRAVEIRSDCSGPKTQAPKARP